MPVATGCPAPRMDFLESQVLGPNTFSANAVHLFMCAKLVLHCSVVSCSLSKPLSCMPARTRAGPRFGVSGWRGRKAPPLAPVAAVRTADPGRIRRRLHGSRGTQNAAIGRAVAGPPVLREYVLLLQLDNTRPAPRRCGSVAQERLGTTGSSSSGKVCVDIVGAWLRMQGSPTSFPSISIDDSKLE